MNSEQKEGKILFVEPNGATANVFSFAMKLPLLGPVRLATQLNELGYDVQVIKENLLTRWDKVEDYFEETDILILTLLTNSANRGYEIAKNYKNIKPDGKVIIGGIHASLNPKEALKHADKVAIGEGTQIIRDLIEDNIEDDIVEGNPLKNLDDRPIPNFSLLKNARKTRTIPVMTSLGCPFNCTFCCVTKVYGRKYRYQSPERTIKELKEQLKYFKRKKVFFYDDNFCANKKISLKLFDLIEKENLNFKWLAQVRADLAKDEPFVKRMAEVGCRRVFIGFESINEETLKDLNKRESVKEMKNAVKVFQKYGISIHGMFIFGSDEDDPEVFKRTIDFCKDNYIECAQFLAITPFPGTQFYKSIGSSRLTSQNWDYYDGFHVNVKPKRMSEFTVMQGILNAYYKVFSAWFLVKRAIRDFIDIFRAKYRSLLYRVNKMLNDFFRSIGMRIVMRRFRRFNKTYLKNLKKSANLSELSLH